MTYFVLSRMLNQNQSVSGKVVCNLYYNNRTVLLSVCVMYTDGRPGLAG